MKSRIRIYNIWDNLLYVFLLLLSILFLIYNFKDLIYGHFSVSELPFGVLSGLVCFFIVCALISNQDKKIKKIEIDDETITIEYTQNCQKQIRVIEKKDISQAEFIIHAEHNMRYCDYNLTLDFINENRDYIHIYHNSTQPEAIRKIFSISSQIPNFSYRIYAKDSPLARCYIEFLAKNGKFSIIEFIKSLRTDKKITFKQRVHIALLILLSIFVISFLCYSVFFM